MPWPTNTSRSYEYLPVLAAALIIIGIQIFFTSFLISILGLRRETGSVTLPNA